MVAVTLIVMLLSQTLLQIFPPALFPLAAPAAPIVEAESVPTPYGLTPAAPPIPPLWLPKELIGKPEVVAMRTANSATYYVGDDTYASVQEIDPIHYQDQTGQWQR